MLDDLPPKLSAVKERQLFERYAESRKIPCLPDLEARDEIWTRNLRMAVLWVRAFCRKRPDAEPYYDDILADMVAMLPRAIDGFRPELGYKFSTYFSNSMYRELSKSYQQYAYAVRVPKNGYTTDARSIPFNEFADTREDGADPVELDYIRTVERNRVQQEVRDAVDALDERDRTAIRKRYGLDGGKSETLAVIGTHLGVTKERARQRLDAVTARLTRSPRLQRLVESR